MSGFTGIQRALIDVHLERDRQHATWGQQDLPDGTGPRREWPYTGNATEVRAKAQRDAKNAALLDDLHWLDLLHEEVAEAFAEADPQRLRAELVQVAAVAVQWIEAIDRRTA